MHEGILNRDIQLNSNLQSKTASQGQPAEFTSKILSETTVVVIVTHSMRSDPDVHLLVKTEPKGLDWEATDLSGRAFIQGENTFNQKSKGMRFWTKSSAQMLWSKKKKKPTSYFTYWSAGLGLKLNFLHCKPCQRNAKHAGEPDIPPVPIHETSTALTKQALANTRRPKTMHLLDSTGIWRNYIFRT